MAFIEPRLGPEAPVNDFPIPQLQRPGELASLSLLPSCIYLPAEQELPPESTRLPWGHSPERVIGEFARWQGARVPARMVGSAKSWLCHQGVDRAAPILPWGAPEDVKKVSPVEASALLLAHMKEAWNHALPEALLPAQEVVITVPASFDEVARALTVNAIRQAGFENFRLVEEPQAAFYDFTARHRHDLGSTLHDIRLVLVIDVGGGTSDFTLVQVGVSPEGPVLRRIAVGEHLMLGGDNMDAAVARKTEERMLTSGRRLSATQWTQLVQTARVAKETLLSKEALENYNLSIAGEGSRLLGSSLSARLTRAEAEEVILDGFFPFCSPTETPRRSTRAAIQELGLPYAQDPAITRHIAAFLRQHADAGFAALGHPLENPASKPPHPLPRPDAILLNGGVFNSPKMAERLVQALSDWWPDAPVIPLLRHQSLELAVARGAAYYGLVRRGMGRRIGGGTAHAFYVGLGSSSADDQPRALCVIPRGHEEGDTVELTGRTFNLALGHPVQFPLYSTTSDRIDKSGDTVLISDELRPLPPIHTILKGAGGKLKTVPVHLRATLTEIGTLELSCVSDISDEQWRLEFETRGAVSSQTLTVTESMPAHFRHAREWIERIYGHKPVSGRSPGPAQKPGPVTPKEIKQLWSQLEQTLGPRDTWRVPVLRELWSALQSGAAKRRRSPDHERVFFQLTGYSLRPGFGYPLDDWRCQQTFALFQDGVQFHKEKPIWTEYWVMWRRIAGGLNPELQQELWTYLKLHLSHRISPHVPKHAAKPKGPQPEGLNEMVRAAAALEHVPAAEKIELGSWILARIQDPSTPSGGPWTWALGRLGARNPLHGSVHQTIPPHVAQNWGSELLKLDLRQVDGALFALAQIARRTGDRTRDLDDSWRTQILESLQTHGAPEPWIRMVREVTALESADEARALGDTLPAGLHLA
jgi:molecular chaperone DnaK (HSP70)